MTERLNPFAAAPQLMKPMLDFSAAVARTGLEPDLIELVKIRASQINGCAVCLHMHVSDARRAGEREERIFMLDAWRESSLYSPRERAALAWTESLTRLSLTHVPDADYETMAAEFTPEEQVKLTLAIVTINGFNKLGVGFRITPGAAAQRAAA